MKEANTKKGKREIILEAAVKVFSSKGYHNTRMEEIATEAGIGKGTVYEYFSSKLHLFQEMLENSIQTYYNTLAQADLDNLTIEERIRLLIAGHIQFCKENKELTRIVFWDTEIIDPELKEWSYLKRKEKEKQMQETIEQAIKAGEIRDINPRLLTLTIGGIIGSLWAPITLEDWELDPQQTADQITNLLMNGVRLVC